MAKSKEYYDNNWQQFKDAPDEFFVPHTYEEVMTWKVAGWELPSSVCCIIRVTDIPTKKTTEYVYRKASAATRKVQQLLNTPDIEFAVADHDSIHHMFPEDLLFNDSEDSADFDDPLVWWNYASSA